MPTEFDDARDYAFFLRDSITLRNGNGFANRWSEQVLASLRAGGVFDNMEDGIVAPATDKLWLDKNTDPAVLKEWDATGLSWAPITFERLFGRAIVTAMATPTGTGNAVVVAQPVPFIPHRMYSLTPIADNSGAATIQVTGVGTYDVKYSDGTALVAQELKTGSPTILLFTGVRFEVLFSLAGIYAIRDQIVTIAAQFPAVTANTMMIDNAAGTAREAKSFADVRKALDLSFLPNYSTPTVVAPLAIYITSTGTDTTGGDINHGSTELTAFATWQAALEHAKVLAKFYGRLSTVELKFGPGSWGIFALGSNLDQGEEFYDFAIRVRSIDNANRAEFTAFSNGCWLPTYLYAYQIKAAYYVVTRRNAMTVNDCSLIDSAVISYAFRAAFGAKLNIFGDINVEDAVSYATAFIYCQDGGYVSLENGDTPSIFPVFNLIGAGNITSALKYRFVLGSGGYIPAVPYPQLTFASNYHVDASSYSTQTLAAQDLANNTGVGGPVVARSGTSVTGTERLADGKFRQWGILSVTSAAVGSSSPASAALTFATAFGANPRIKYNWGLNTVIVAAPQPSTTGVQFTVNNLGGSPASFSVYWEASGLL